MHWYDLTNADSHSLFCTSLFFMQTICLFWHWHHGSQSGEARRSSPGRPRARGFSTHQLGQPVPAEMSKWDSMWRYASFREFGGLGKNRRYRMFSTFLPVAVLLLGEAVFFLGGGHWAPLSKEEEHALEAGQAGSLMMCPCNHYHCNHCHHNHWNLMVTIKFNFTCSIGGLLVPSRCTQERDEGKNLPCCCGSHPGMGE